MKEPQTPLYVRLGADQARRLEEAVSVSGKSKRQVIEDSLREHLRGPELVVGRISSPGEGMALAQDQEAPEILTAAEAAALLRVDESVLVAAAERGELPGRAIGEEWRFSRGALLAWLRGGESEARGRAEAVLDSGLEYAPGDPVTVRVVHRDQRITATDDGAAIERVGRPPGWRQAADRVAEELVVNVARHGVVSLPVVRVGPSEDEVVRRVARASLALYQDLLELES